MTDTNTLEFPVEGEYNWAEKLLGSLELLAQNGQLLETTVTTSTAVIDTLATVLLLEGSRTTVTTVEFTYTDRMRVLINHTGAPLQVGDEQIAVGETAMVLPLGDSAYTKLSLGTQVCEQVEFPIQTQNGVTALWVNGELRLGMDFSRLTATDVARIREAILE